MLDLQNNIKSSQVCGPQPCELYFFAYLCIRNQVKRNSNGKGIRIWYVGCRKQLHRPNRRNQAHEG